MYKRIYNSEEIVVDYYNDGKPMIRVSQFADGHWQDEHFVELPEEVEPVVHAKWISEVVQRCDWKGKKRSYYQPCSCSRCHTPAHFKTHRCSECGAHMDEEVDDGK